MPDTGAPWNIPYVESSDLVSDWPADSLALANAIDSGLDAAGGLVAVKHALFTGTQTNSTAAGANFAITDLTITHEVADAANKLIVSGFVGVLDGEEQGFAGIAMAVDGSVVNVGDTASGKISTSTGGSLLGTGLGGAVLALPHSFTYVYTPGAGSKTYTLRAFNTNSSTETVYINRGKVDDARTGRGVSGLVIQEVKV